jgi:hypothetical protein
MQDTVNPLFDKAFAIASALAGVVAQTGDSGLIQLAANVSARVQNLTLDSEPGEINAVIAMLETTQFAMDRLARAAAADADTVAA